MATSIQNKPRYSLRRSKPGNRTIFQLPGLREPKLYLVPRNKAHEISTTSKRLSIEKITRSVIGVNPEPRSVNARIPYQTRERYSDQAQLAIATLMVRNRLLHSRPPRIDRDGQIEACVVSVVADLQVVTVGRRGVIALVLSRVNLRAV